MKIGIITFHFPYNCGAGLQCYALQKTLENLGHEVEIINYCPNYHKNLYTPLRNPFISAKRAFNGKGNVLKKTFNSCKAFIFSIYSWKNYKKMKEADKLFSNFIKSNLKTTKKYKTIKQLRNDAPQCDVYVSGSDQLWNESLTGNGFDEAYFLKFGEDTVYRFTYAISTRFSDKDNKEKEKNLKKLLSDLKSISVRENNDINYLNDIVIPKRVIQTIDPTLLLEPKYYNELMCKAKLEDEKYILTYSISSSTQKIVNKIAKKLSDLTGLKIVNALSYPKSSSLNTNVKICSPESFLWYINNAEYVISDSFHSTVFSLIFKKKFIALPRGAGDTRVSELLNKLEIDGHVTNDVEQAIIDVVKEIDYNKVFDIFESLRLDSLEFINQNIAKAELLKTTGE